MAFALAPLPYADTALDPVISARTISFHHGLHHKTYVDNLNKLVENDPLGAMPLVDVVRAVGAVIGQALDRSTTSRREGDHEA